jgi:amidase
MPWKDDVVKGVGLPEKSTFAILWDDGVVAPHPPIVDALKRTRDALLAAGHEVIDWKPIEHQKAWDLIVSLVVFSDQKQTDGGTGETIFARWWTGI